MCAKYVCQQQNYRAAAANMCSELSSIKLGKVKTDFQFHSFINLRW